jgi:hypothetical protein
VPLIQPVRDLLDLYRLRLGNPTSGGMFATASGTPVDLHNLFSDRIDPVLNACTHCDKTKAAHLRKRFCKKKKPQEYEPA